MSVSDRNSNRAEVVDRNFLRLLSAWERDRRAPERVRGPDEPIRAGEPMTCRDAVELFESQIVARCMDLEARAMRARNEGFYTIGSAGHEGNAVVGRLTRHTDMAFLHYRSGALMAERARQVPGQDFIRDSMLSFAASSLDPIAGGRHRVWGSATLWTPPQTSTIASHLPKSVGAAFFLRRSRRLRLTPELPDDSLILCTFGDAGANHAAAQTAFNAAAWMAHQGLQAPILFVCEDNGLGISVPTPEHWLESALGSRYGLAYFQASGLDLLEAFRTTQAAVALCRARRIPVFLHLKMVRLLGHAGTDNEQGYRDWEQIEAAEAQDPLLHSARLLLTEDVLSAPAIRTRYEEIRTRVQERAREAAQTPKLTSAAQILEPLAPSRPDAVRSECARTLAREERIRLFGGEEQLPENTGPRPMAALINLGLTDLMRKYPEMVLFGEDVARKGGVYNVTPGLEAQFGPGRVFNTLLDETMILGMAIGAGHLGLLPLPEIQYLAYYHNAEDQIRSEACSLSFFSSGQFRNPMVIRIPGWAYQKGFGGHFHNDNSIAALRDVPGLVIATPSRGDDAVRMLRTLVAMAKADGRVCALIEPIALYRTRDLYTPRDGLWQFPYPSPESVILAGEGHVYHPEANDLTILTFANGLYMSLRAARTLREEHGVQARVVDVRWLNPLNEDFLTTQALATRRVLVVDESRRTGGLGEAILALLCERCGSDVTARRLNALDTYVPLGPAANCVLPAEPDIVAGVLRLMDMSSRSVAGPGRPIAETAHRG